MIEHDGWSYLNSNDMEEFSKRISEEGITIQNQDGSGSFYGDDGSWAYKNEDGSGSYYAADGSWGYRNADGSGSYHGDDGSWGYRNADGSSSFHGGDGSWGYKNSDGSGLYYDSDEECVHWDSDEDNTNHDAGSGEEEYSSFGVGDAIAAAAIGFGLFAVAGNSNQHDSSQDKEEKAREERRRKKKEERIRKRQEWFGTPTGKRIRKAGIAIIILASFALATALFYASLKCVGHSSSNLIGSNHNEAASLLTESGFWNVKQIEVQDLDPTQANEDGIVTNVNIASFTEFDEDLMVPCFISPEITYHTIKRINPPMSSDEAKKMSVQEVVSKFEEMGFVNVESEARRDVLLGLLSKENDVIEVSIGDTTSFSVEDEFKIDSKIVVVYHAKIFD